MYYSVGPRTKTLIGRLNDALERKKPMSASPQIEP